MTPLDHQLRQLLRREPAPPDLTASVMRRLHGQPTPHRRISRQRQVVLAVAASLVLAAATSAVVLGSRLATERRAVTGEEAYRQALIALEIASSKTNLARDRVLAATRPLEQPLTD